MVMKPEPWGEALDEVLPDGATLVVPTPSGTPFTQAAGARAGRAATTWSSPAAATRASTSGWSTRPAARADVREISIGDYVLNGGEVAALAITEAVVRLLPGFMGNPGSLLEESHEDGLLEYPVYTKPASWRGRDVPPVLLSGDHAAIAAWRRDQSVRRTAERRPDLLHASAAVGVADLDALVAPVTRADLGEYLTLQRACFPPDLHEPLDALTDDVLGDTGFVPACGRPAGRHGQLPAARRRHRVAAAAADGRARPAGPGDRPLAPGVRRAGRAADGHDVLPAHRQQQRRAARSSTSAPATAPAARSAPEWSG